VTTPADGHWRFRDVPRSASPLVIGAFSSVVFHGSEAALPPVPIAAGSAELRPADLVDRCQSQASSWSAPECGIGRDLRCLAGQDGAPAITLRDGYGLALAVISGQIAAAVRASR
jgi:hypothetical protein